MGEKKSKALANKLMDDLLKEESVNIDLEDVASIEDVNLGAPEEEEHDPARTVKTPIPGMDSTNPTGTERTMRIDAANKSANPAPAPAPTAKSSSAGATERASVGRLATFRSSGGGSATEAALAQSESLRIAQNRILELEQEIERLRLQNEQLGAAAETLRRSSDELGAENQKMHSMKAHLQAEAEQEKNILLEGKESVQRELELLRTKNEELELRVSTNVQKIRVRERELENRLELVKMENAALLRSKDELLLDLKRQVDQLNLELNNYRTKNQELNRNMNDKQEMLRRTVKTLRLALSMLEGEEAPKTGLKKAK